MARRTGPSVRPATHNSSLRDQARVAGGMRRTLVRSAAAVALMVAPPATVITLGTQANVDNYAHHMNVPAKVEVTLGEAALLFGSFVGGVKLSNGVERRMFVRDKQRAQQNSLS